MENTSSFENQLLQVIKKEPLLFGIPSGKENLYVSANTPASPLYELVTGEQTVAVYVGQKKLLETDSLPEFTHFIRGEAAKEEQLIRHREHLYALLKEYYPDCLIRISTVSGVPGIHTLYLGVSPLVPEGYYAKFDEEELAAETLEEAYQWLLKKAKNHIAKIRLRRLFEKKEP